MTKACICGEMYIEELLRLRTLKRGSVMPPDPSVS